MPARVSVLILVALVALVAACGVRGAPTIPPPLFGETDMPPVPPRPYDREDTNNLLTTFATRVDPATEPGFAARLEEQRAADAAPPEGYPDEDR